MRSISVVLPVYNESESIAACLRGLDAALRSEEHEILVCYDTEEDSTLPAIAAMPDRPASLKLVRNTLGRGALNAIRTGFAAARGDVVVTSMADLSDPPEVILGMAKRIRAGADVVSGSRYMRGGSQTGGPWLKRTLSRIAGLSLRWIAGIGTHDATSNFRGYSKAFLDTVTVESRGGFEIALELTVKAHLAGRVVAEVPSSWVDRSAGSSNFRMWRWMPSYLRWYLRAAAQPVVVGILAAAAFLSSLRMPPWSEPPVLVHRTTALLCAAGAACAFLVARSLRGRTRLVDALHAPIWVQPWHAAILGTIPFGADFAFSTVASITLLGTTCGPRRLLDGSKSLARSSLPASFGRGLGFGVLIAAVWVAHASVHREVPGGGLDASWVAALDRAVIRNMRAGVDYVFTLGPLGALSTRAYTPELFGFKLLAWNGAVQLGLAILMLRLAMRIRGILGRLLFIALLAYPTYNDSYVYLAILGATVWVIERERRGNWPALFALAAMVVFAFTKFSYAIPAAIGSLAIVIGDGRGPSWRRAALLGFAALVLVLLVWWASGQQVADLPTWIRRSLELSSGYGQACSTAAPPGTRWPAAGVIGLLALQSAMIATGRPIRVHRAAVACVALAALWVAFKGGFVRGEDHTPIFFGFTLLAPFVLAVPALECRFLGVAGRLCGLGCVALSFAGIVAADRPASTWTQDLLRAGKTLRQRAAWLIDPAGLSRRNELDLRNARDRLALPRTKAVVGDRSIDAVSTAQGLLFLNDLRWNPRPVFQGYLTFSPELMALNERFLVGDRASDFLLFRLESIDFHLPAMEDALALRTIARDYEPVLAEGGFLLLRRAPRRTVPQAPELQFETSLAFGETLELPSLAGSVHLLELDFTPSWRERVRSFLEKARNLEAEVGLDSGEVVKVRLVPDMIRVGVIFDPFLRSQTDWFAWVTGGRPPRPVWLRIPVTRTSSAYHADVGVRILRDDGIAPTPRPDLAEEATFSWFRTTPSEHRAAVPPTPVAMADETVLLFRAPSEMSFEVAAGPHLLTGRYGILPNDWKPAGASFRASLRMPGGEEVDLLDVHLDPVRRQADRRLRFVRASFEAPARATLVLRTIPGPGPDVPSLDTVWSEILVR